MAKHQSSTFVRLSARTDKGEVRYHNEDNFLVASNLSTKDWTLRNDVFEADDAGCLLVVADGMGGAKAGEVASQIAVDEVKKHFSKLLQSKTENEFLIELEKALFRAHLAIVKHAADHAECLGMGTTLLLVWVVGSKAFLVWSGDSRCYQYSQSTGLKLVTEDHSVVWDKVKKGEITKEEAATHDERHVITQSLGIEQYPPKPSHKVVYLAQNDRLLLCSDGLNSMIPDDEIEAILNQNDDITTNAQQLIEAANTAGGEDNTTVVMYELVAQTNVKAPIKTPFWKKWVWFLTLILLSAMLSPNLSNIKHQTSNIL